MFVQAKIFSSARIMFRHVTDLLGASSTQAGYFPWTCHLQRRWPENFLHVIGNILHNSSRKTSSRCDLPTEISELFWEAFGYWVCLLTFLIIEC